MDFFIRLWFLVFLPLEKKYFGLLDDGVCSMFNWKCSSKNIYSSMLITIHNDLAMNGTVIFPSFIIALARKQQIMMNPPTERLLVSLGPFIVFLTFPSPDLFMKNEQRLSITLSPLKISLSLPRPAFSCERFFMINRRKKRMISTTIRWVADQLPGRVATGAL